MAHERQILDAVAEATRQGKLRPNAVDSLTAEQRQQPGARGARLLHFHQWEKDEIEVRLLLKGGGCENKNIQYSVPCELAAARARRQKSRWGQEVHSSCRVAGTGPWVQRWRNWRGYRGGQSVGLSMRQGTIVPHARRCQSGTGTGETLKQYILEHANELGIGMMGFGGNATLIGCKIAAQHRLPASFFVSVAYDCWAFRRLGVVLDAGSGAIKRWLFRDEKRSVPALSRGQAPPRTGKEVILRTPISESDIRGLKVGDMVLIQGEMYTGRDSVHSFLMKNRVPGRPFWQRALPLRARGPQRKRSLEDDCGGSDDLHPRRTLRSGSYQAFRHPLHHRQRGHGSQDTGGIEECGAVYLNAIGGAAQYYARCIREVRGVHLLEFGIPEALWHLEVVDLPAIVTMDAHGNSLHADVEKASATVLAKLADPVFRAADSRNRCLPRDRGGAGYRTQGDYPLTGAIPARGFASPGRTMLRRSILVQQSQGRQV